MSEQNTKNQEPSTKEAPGLPDPAGMMALGGAPRTAAGLPLVMSNPIDCELAELIGEKPGAVSGYSQHINPAMRLLERLREKGIAENYVIQMYQTWGEVEIQDAFSGQIHRSSVSDPNIKLPRLIASAVLNLLKARRPRVGGADRLALAEDGKEDC